MLVWGSHFAFSSEGGLFLFPLFAVGVLKVCVQPQLTRKIILTQVTQILAAFVIFLIEFK